MPLLTGSTAEDYAEHRPTAGDRSYRGVLSIRSGPVLLRLWVRDCPAGGAQQQTLADVAAASPHASILVWPASTPQLGGQELAPGFRLPCVKAVTLAAAGRLMLRSERDNGSLD